MNEEASDPLGDAACSASCFVEDRPIPEGFYLFCCPEDRDVAEFVWNATGDLEMLEPLVGGSRIVHENPEHL